MAREEGTILECFSIFETGVEVVVVEVVLLLLVVVVVVVVVVAEPAAVGVVGGRVEGVGVPVAAAAAVPAECKQAKGKFVCKAHENAYLDNPEGVQISPRFRQPVPRKESTDVTHPRFCWKIHIGMFMCWADSYRQIHVLGVLLGGSGQVYPI